MTTHVVPVTTAAQARVAMLRAVERYQRHCAEFAEQTAQHDRLRDPVRRAASIAADRDRAEIGSDAAWARCEASLYAAVALALSTRDGRVRAA